MTLPTIHRPEVWYENVPLYTPPIGYGWICQCNQYLTDNAAGYSQHKKTKSHKSFLQNIRCKHIESKYILSTNKNSQLEKSLILTKNKHLKSKDLNKHLKSKLKLYKNNIKNIKHARRLDDKFEMAKTLVNI